MTITHQRRFHRASALAGAAALAMGLFTFAAPTVGANPVTEFSSNLSSQLLPGNPGGDDECPVDPHATEIIDNIDQVPGPPAHDGRWIYSGETNYNDCNALTYATLELEGGIVSSPKQLMLFHEGDYIGVGSLVPQTHHIVSANETSVTVDYVDYEAMYADGAAHADWKNYLTRVTYHWDFEEGKVVPEGRIPNQNL